MGHHHHKKGHGMIGHHSQHHAMPCEVAPVPDDVHVGIQFTAEAIIAATSKRCKQLGQGGCGRVIAADMPLELTEAPTAAPTTAAVLTVHCPASKGGGSSSSTAQVAGKAAVSSGIPPVTPPMPLSSPVASLPNTTGSHSCASNDSASCCATQRVAIKTALPPHHGAPWQHSRSLMVEARTLRLAAHPAVIKLLGSCWSDELDALVFELLSGGDLQGRMGLAVPAAAAAADAEAAVSVQSRQQQQTRADSSKPKVVGSSSSSNSSSSKYLSWRQRLLISYQLASALASLHSSRPQQLLHRDMKPENVLLDDENNARLTDFGIATVVHMEGTSKQQQQQQQGSAGAARLHGVPTCGSVMPPKSPVPAAMAAGTPLAWRGGAGTPPMSPIVGAAATPTPAAAAGSGPCAWGAAAHRAVSAAHSPQGSRALRNIAVQHQQHPHGRSGGSMGHHVQQQQRHHGSSNCSSAAADAVLARLAARGVGSTSAARGGGGGSSSSSVTSRPAAAAAAAAGGEVMVVHHGWAGTHDYLDPMYEQLGQLCDRSDVYGLGLIMCQLVMDAGSDPKQAKRVLQHTAHEQKVLHLPAATADWPQDSALAYAELALHCAAADRKQRLSAAQLAAALHELVLQAANSSSSQGGGSVSGKAGATTSSSDSSSSCRVLDVCPAFPSVTQLLPGKYSLVPSCLHGAAPAGATAAAAAAAQAHSCLVAAVATTNTSSCSGSADCGVAKTGKTAEASWAACGRCKSAVSTATTTNSSSFAEKKQVAEAAKLQEQQTKKLQQLTKRIMSVELLLDATGAITGGSVTATAPAAAAAGAARGGRSSDSSTASAAAAVVYAAGWTGNGSSGGTSAVGSNADRRLSCSASHSSTGIGSASSTANAAGSTAAAIAVTPSPVAFPVLGGCYSAGSGSIVFCCNSSRTAAATAAAGQVQAGADSSSNSSRSSRDAFSPGASWYVFAGSYKDGKLLGEWKLADATTAAAESDSVRAAIAASAGLRSSRSPGARSLLRIASSSSGGTGTVAPTIAASYDWVMFHTLWPEDADSSRGYGGVCSSAAARASQVAQVPNGTTVVGGLSAAAASGQGLEQLQQHPVCSTASGSVPAYRSASGSLMLPIC